MPRCALLLGIDKYEEPTLLLPAAARDTRELDDALVLAGFDPARVDQVVGAKTYLSTKILRKRIRQLLANAAPDDEVLIYFSGHGIEWQGSRLLIRRTTT